MTEYEQDDERECPFVHGNKHVWLPSYKELMDHMRLRHNPPENSPIRSGRSHTEARHPPKIFTRDAKNLNIDQATEKELMDFWLALETEAENPPPTMTLGETRELWS